MLRVLRPIEPVQPRMARRFIRGRENLFYGILGVSGGLLVLRGPKCSTWNIVNTTMYLHKMRQLLVNAGSNGVRYWDLRGPGVWARTRTTPCQ